MLSWRYEYEPFDLNGWIPDFMLFGAEKVLVEVKPFTAEKEFNIKKIWDSVTDTEYSTNEILLIGVSIFPTNYFDGAALGWLEEMGFKGEYPDGNVRGAIDEAVINHWHGAYGFFHGSHSWRDRMTGLYDGDGMLDVPSFNDMKFLWNEAGSEVQWKK
jgi:hypothetical protein